ncbi:MAG: hypothetical protein WCG61_05325 [Chlorobium sp.]
MSKKLWLAAGIAGTLLGHPSTDAKAEVSIHIGLGERTPERAPFVFDMRPRFIPLPDMGFAVAVGTPYDIIFFGNSYYAFHNGIWYGSGDYRGPWIVVHESRLPSGIRRYRWEEIRRSRDVEYRRHDRRYDGRYDWKDNRRQRLEGNERDNGNRDERGNRSSDNARDQRNDNQNQRNPGSENRRGEGGRRD